MFNLKFVILFILQYAKICTVCRIICIDMQMKMHKYAIRSSRSGVNCKIKYKIIVQGAFCHILHSAVCKICIICCNIPDCILCIVHILLHKSTFYFAYYSIFHCRFCICFLACLAYFNTYYDFKFAYFYSYSACCF